MKTSAIIIVLFSIFISCEKENFTLEGEEYLIFGTYNGFCQGNCTSLFKINQEQLLSDDMSTFVPGETVKFEEAPLSKDKYDVAYEAFDRLPDELNETMDKSFGCPGCVDQDIIYLEYFDGVETHIWQVDTQVEDLPGYLVDYADRLVRIVGILSE